MNKSRIALTIALLVIPMFALGFSNPSVSSSYQPLVISEHTSSTPTTSATTTTAPPVSPSVSLTLSYSVPNGTHPTAAPTFYYIDKSGLPKSVVLLASPNEKIISVQAGSSWNVDLTLNSTLPGERWAINPQDSAGEATMDQTIVFQYFHQFQLTMQVDPLGSGTATASPAGVQNWHNASTVVTIDAKAESGFKFQSWECSGQGCYPGLNETVQVTMNAPIVETARFSPVVIVRLLGEGSDVPQYVIVDTGSPVELPTEFVWVPNSNHTIIASPRASCDFSFFSFNGCNYALKEWRVNGVTIEGNTLHLNATNGLTVTAVWEKSYLNLEILVLVAGLAVAVPSLWLVRRPRKRPRTVPITLKGPVGPLYRVGSLTDVGKVRSNNEDSILAVEIESKPNSAILLAVADGVGGSQKGEVASNMALETITAETSGLMTGPVRHDILEALKTAIEAANDAVVHYGMEHRESEGMATTIVASIIHGNDAYIAHAGDSRAYLVNRGEIKQLTKDHSQVQESVDAGKITAEEARHYPGRNIITRAIGASTDIEIDTSNISLSPGDRILLCTDGLWEPVSDEEIHKIVMQSPELQAGCESLVKLANDRGGKDNVSVVIVEFTGGAAAKT